MYIRAVDTKTKTGKTYTKYQLIESYRSEKGPRQRIILTLSDFDLAKPLWPALARAVSERLSGVESIFAEDVNRPGFYRDSVSCQSGNFLTVFERSREPPVVEPMRPLPGLPFHSDLIVKKTDRMD